jgi:hypothetical protein
LTRIVTPPCGERRFSSPANWRSPITSLPSRASTVTRSSAFCDPTATAPTGARVVTSTVKSALTSIASKLVRP